MSASKTFLPAPCRPIRRTSSTYTEAPLLLGWRMPSFRYVANPSQTSWLDCDRMKILPRQQVPSDVGRCDKSHLIPRRRKISCTSLRSSSASEPADVPESPFAACPIACAGSDICFPASRPFFALVFFRFRPHRSNGMPPDTRNSNAEIPTRMTPAHAFGENTKLEPNATMAEPMRPTRPMECVKYIASGSSDQAIPRNPLRDPLARHARKLRPSPIIVTITQVVPVAILVQVLKLASPSRPQARRVAP